MSDIQETLRSSLDQCRQECAKLTMAEQHLTKALAEALAENARFREALEHIAIVCNSALPERPFDAGHYYKEIVRGAANRIAKIAGV